MTWDLRPWAGRSGLRPWQVVPVLLLAGAAAVVAAVFAAALVFIWLLEG